MRTRLGEQNPFEPGRAAFAWEHVPAGSDAHLDFGCYEGVFLDSLRAKGVRRLVGVDASSEAVERGRIRFPQIELVHMTQTIPVPFPNGAFSSVSLMDVIEHVDDQVGLLRELHRVLRSDGILIITVPGQYALSFLDMGNFKFRFPRLHRWYYSARHSRGEYERRYISNPDGLMGDISAKKGWHEHFSREKLGNLLRQGGFVPDNFDGSNFWNRFLVFPELGLRWLPPARGLFRGLKNVDARWFASSNLFCVARKAGG